MAIQPEEITRVLKERIEGFDPETKMKEVGYVLQAGDGIARVYGLNQAVSGELLKFPHGVSGLACSSASTPWWARATPWSARAA